MIEQYQPPSLPPQPFKVGETVWVALGHYTDPEQAIIQKIQYYSEFADYRYYLDSQIITTKVFKNEVECLEYTLDSLLKSYDTFIYHAELVRERINWVRYRIKDLTLDKST